MFEKLHKWEARQPEIIRQLDKVRSFRKELIVARSQLLALQQNTSSISNNQLPPPENKKAPGPAPNNSSTARDTNRPTTMHTETDNRQESVPPVNLTRERPTVHVRSSLESDNREQTPYIGYANKLQDADRSCTLHKNSTMKRKRRKLSSPASTRLPFTNRSVPDQSRYWELPVPSHCRPPLVQARTSTDNLPSAFQRRVVGDPAVTSYHAPEPTTRTLQAGSHNLALGVPMLDDGSEYTKVPRSSHVACPTSCHRGMTPRNGFLSRAAPFRLPNMIQALDGNPLPPNISFNGYGIQTTEDSELQPLGLYPSYGRMRIGSSSRSYQARSAYEFGTVNHVTSGDWRPDISSAQTSHSMTCHRGDRPDQNWPPLQSPGPFASSTGYGP